MTETPPQPPNGRVVGWLNAVKGLTISNVLVIALLVVIAIPAYTIWKALNDEKIMDRLLSTYEELGDQMTGCTLRHAQQRGGPELWGISRGFAFQGEARYFLNVALGSKPTDAEALAYCESLVLIADRMQQGNGNEP